MANVFLKSAAAAAALLLLGSAQAFAQADVAAYQQAMNARFPAWLESLWPDAQARGVDRKTFDYALKGVKVDWKLPDLQPPETAGPNGPPLPGSMRKKSGARHQPEFDAPSRYFPAAPIAALVKAGSARLAEWKTQLDAIEASFGVSRHIIISVWGRETSFGRAKLPHYAIEAMATQAYIGRRQDMFRDELLTGLQVLQQGHTTREKMKASWAGAMGYTQFLPTHFMKYAVDFDGDGKRDIWGSIGDALASTANFLKQSGWENGKTWGYEVAIPESFQCALEGPGNARTIGEWAKMGMTRTHGRAFPAERLSEKAFLIAPAGKYGPIFLGLNNFQVIKQYNMADLYALFVGHVADRMMVDRPFVHGWDKVDRFTRDEILEMQKVLVTHGYDVGKVDGLNGFRTRVAIGKYQSKIGMRQDCYPSRPLLEAVRRDGNRTADAAPEQ